jgi:pilin isopeptide linkage protein
MSYNDFNSASFCSALSDALSVDVDRFSIGEVNINHICGGNDYGNGGSDDNDTPAPEAGSATTPVRLQARKELRGGALLQHAYTFQATDLDSKQTVIATNDANGDINFPPLDLTPGRHRISIHELTPSNADLLCDDTLYNAVANVTDDGYGNLQATVEYQGLQPPLFINRIQPFGVGVADFTVSASKLATGAPLQNGQFTFGLFDSNGNEVASATNDANGDIVFPTLSLTTTGTHNYTMRETSTSGGGWIVDNSTIWPVNVTVTDDGSGNYDATVDIPGGPARFVNAFVTYSPGSATVQARAFAVGGLLCAGQFTCALYDDQGAEVASVKNDAAGKFNFPAQTFSAPGVYHYTMSETAACGNNWSLDTKVIPVTVTVTADAQGNLSTQVSYTGQAAFVNRWQGPQCNNDCAARCCPQPRYCYNSCNPWGFFCF